jgi:hypothetical protein
MPTGPFIDPTLLQKALKPAAKVAAIPQFAAGPSAPHTDDEHDDEPPALGWPNWKDWLPDGMPMHYTDTLDPIWAEFDDPSERTAARLQALLEQVSDESLKIHALAIELFMATPTYKIPQAERDRFRAEYLAYGKRLNGYRESLAALEPTSTATDDVVVGLVQTKPGAGPVPDAIMHMYFARQLGILDDHAQDMGKGFVGRTLNALQAVGESIGEVTDTVSDAIGDRIEAKETVLTESLRRAAWIIGGVVAGGVVIVGGLIVLAVRAGRRRETIVLPAGSSNAAREGGSRS